MSLESTIFKGLGTNQEHMTINKVPDNTMDFCTSPGEVSQNQPKEHCPNFDVESENARLQVHFEKEMKEKARGHQKVSVLLLSWEKEAEDNLDTADEVKRLSTVFEGLYNFRVCPQTLNTGQGKKPRHQIHRHLANFVHDEDGKGTLLIIYYAGHGLSDNTTGRLLLAQGNPKGTDNHLNQIVWNEAECLINQTDADMLLIFDCCHAGLLAGTTIRDFSNKILEFLGATQANETTQAPGDESFTSALIWALESLSKDLDGFTTSQLLTKILEAPYFPKDGGQRPCLTERGYHSLRRLRIAAVPNTNSEHNATPTSDTEEQPEIKCILNLSFMFTECPTQDYISNLCHGLREMLQQDLKNSPLQQVLWRGLFPKDAMRYEISAAAEKFIWKLRHKSMSKNSTTSSTSSKLPEIVLESSAEAASESPRRMEKLIQGRNSVQTVVSVTQMPQTQSALTEVRGSYVMKSVSWTDQKSYLMSLLTVFLLGCLAARASPLVSAFTEF